MTVSAVSSSSNPQPADLPAALRPAAVQGIIIEGIKDCLEYSEHILNNGSMTAQIVQFSDLSRKSKEVAELVEHGPVTITRRDGESLLLVKASDAERQRHGQLVAAQVVGAAVQTWPDSLAQALRQPFPWVEFLNEEEREAFAHEVVDVARACAALATFDRLESVVNSWRATAEAIALGIDPSGADLHWLEEPAVVLQPRRHQG